MCWPCVWKQTLLCNFKSFAHQILPQLLQCEEGLQTYGLLASICQYPVVWGTVFVVGKGHPVTANCLIDSFDIQYSESQVKREAEADTHTFFVSLYSVGMNGKLNFLQY